MQRTLLLSLLIACCTATSSGPFGCSKSTCPPPPPMSADYRVPASPENVMNNLIVSYRRREIETYAELLHRNFVFRFQDGDAPPELGREFWTHDEDSTGTAALFYSPQVATIFIDLTYRDAEPALEPELEGAMKIRVSPMKMTVDDVTGTTYLVEGDIQDMFFVRGDGADSTRWYLIEWRDIRGGGAGKPLADAAGVAVKLSTWGKLKQKF